MAGPAHQQKWLHRSCREAGLELKPPVLYHVGDEYTYLRDHHRRTEDDMHISPGVHDVEKAIEELGLQSEEGVNTPIKKGGTYQDEAK